MVQDKFLCVGGPWDGRRISHISYSFHIAWSKPVAVWLKDAIWLKEDINNETGTTTPFKYISSIIDVAEERIYYYRESTLSEWEAVKKLFANYRGEADHALPTHEEFHR